MAMTKPATAEKIAKGDLTMFPMVSPKLCNAPIFPIVIGFPSGPITTS